MPSRFFMGISHKALHDYEARADLALILGDQRVKHQKEGAGNRKTSGINSHIKEIRHLFIGWRSY